VGSGASTGTSTVGAPDADPVALGVPEVDPVGLVVVVVGVGVVLSVAALVDDSSPLSLHAEKIAPMPSVHIKR
jgi:hypothetical protein